jgi:hypothetical protein
VNLRWVLVGALFAISGCAAPRQQPLDLRPAWACTVRNTVKDSELSVTRTLDAHGAQLGADVQWSTGAFDGGRLSFSALQHTDGLGDPPIRPRELLVSWSGFGGRMQRSRLLVVLHPPGEAPNPLDGVLVIPYLNGLIGAVIPWQRVAALEQVSPSAMLSVIDSYGRVIRSASVDLRVAEAAVDQARAALDDTRSKAATFEKSCEPITEWMRL